MSRAESAATAADEDDAVMRLRWCFGFNKDLPGGVINLGSATQKAIAYIAGHTGVLYDVRKHTQIQLQGHANAITSLCASADRRWLVTADSGTDSLIIVWDTKSGEPVKTIARPHAEGVLAMALSPDSMFLATLSKDAPQQLALWDWTVDRDHTSAPLVSVEVPVGAPHRVIRFDPTDPRKLISTGEKRVTFWSWDETGFKYFAPAMGFDELRRDVGSITFACFSPLEGEAFASTTTGDVVVLEELEALEDGGPRWRALKAVHVHDSPITVLETVNEYVCTGDADGLVRFFDHKLRLIAWFEDLEAGPVTSISFANAGGLSHPGASFVTPDFLVGTANAFVVWLKSFMAEETDAEFRRGELILQGMDDAVHGVACSPVTPEFVCTTAGGCLQVWNYSELRLVIMKVLDNLVPRCVAYSPDGRWIGVGFTDGSVRILNPETLEQRGEWHPGKSAVHDIRFAPDSRHLAVFDEDKTVALFRIEVPLSQSGPMTAAPAAWQFIGRIRAHTQPIVAIDWFQLEASDHPSLVSVGADCMLFEYDIGESSISTGLVVKTKFQVDQLGTPTAASFLPAVGAAAARAASSSGEAAAGATTETMVAVANDQYKFRLYNVASGIFRKMALCPVYGGCVTSLRPLNGAPNYMAYATSEKVIGLVQLPLDGNPDKSVGMIAHCSEVAAIDTSHDGQFVLSAGGSDNIVCLTQLNTVLLDRLAAAHGADAIEPFVSLVEGGADGQFMREIEEYFLFAQVRAQGEQSRKPFEVSRLCPIQCVPDMMRALGYFPSEREIQDLISELRYRHYVAGGEIEEHMDFATFLRAYVNHRPVFSITVEDVRAAFLALGAARGNGLVDRDVLFRELAVKGERLGKEELGRVLEVLVGERDPSRATPAKLTADQFGVDVLGIETGGE